MFMSNFLKQDRWQKSYTVVLSLASPTLGNQGMQIPVYTLFSEEKVEFQLTSLLQLALEVLIFFWS